MSAKIGTAVAPVGDEPAHAHKGRSVDMRHLIFRLTVALLAFMIGVFTPVIWDRRQQIIDTCTDVVLNWQD